MLLVPPDVKDVARDCAKQSLHRGKRAQQQEPSHPPEPGSEEDWEQVSLHSRQSMGMASPRCESPYVVHPGNFPGGITDLSSSWIASGLRTPSPTPATAMASPRPDAAASTGPAAGQSESSQRAHTAPWAAGSEHLSEAGATAAENADSEEEEEEEDQEADDEQEEVESAAEGHAGSTSTTIELHQARESELRPPQRNCFWRLMMTIPLLPVTVVVSLLLVTTTLIVHHRSVKASSTRTTTTQNSAARTQAAY